jgi:hypothetical protein
MQSPVPALARQLRAMKGVLAKAEAHAREQGADPGQMLGLRLAPDMLPLVNQVRIACDHAKGATYRLAGREVPPLADEEASFQDLQARLDRTLELIAAVPEAEFEGAEGREVVLRTRMGEMTLTGSDYLWFFALPNFFFHATTAYDVLRANGVPLGKRDFLGA